ncbi:MAG: amidohydrolase family protein [Caldilineaceae bacterium]|nr:amidohydrolase family protein [Caldilineaceae bacterium]
MGTIVWAGVGMPDAAGVAHTNFAVYIEGATIVATGAKEELAAAYPAADVVGGDAYLLLPGLINSHDHGRGLSTLTLGVADDLLELWLLGLAVLPAVDARLLAQLEGVTLLRSGVTATAHSHNPADWETMAAESDATIAGYRAAGVRVVYHPPHIDQNVLVYADRERFLAGLPADLQTTARSFLQLPRRSTEEYLALCSALHQRYHDAHGHLVHIQVSPAGGQWCSDELILASCAWARANNTRVQMHFLETKYQAVYAYRRWGKSFLRHMADIGALGPWLTLAHMIWVEEADLPLLVDHGVAVASNPSSNLRIRSGIAPLARYHALGIPVGIGLDGYALDDDQDYLRELRLAWTLGNRPGAAVPTLSSAEILHMGTRGGAAVTFGTEAPLGHLAPGALADLVLLDWRALEGIWRSPLARPHDLLLRRGQRRHVRHVMVHGEWVLRDGRAVRIDEAALTGEIRDVLQRHAATQAETEILAARALAPHLRTFYQAWDAELDAHPTLPGLT